MQGKEEVILVRPGEVDRFGDPTGEVTTIGIFVNCVVWPRVSTEVVAEGTKITEGYNIWIPWRPAANQATYDDAVALEGTDLVVVRGQEWRVEGTPADQRNTRSKRLGIQMVVKRDA